jgi:hypothetical protein
MKSALTLLLLATLLCSCTTSVYTGPPYLLKDTGQRPVLPASWTGKTLFGLPLPLSFSHTIYF